MLSNLPWSGEVFVDMGGMFRAIYILYAKQKKSISYGVGS